MNRKRAFDLMLANTKPNVMDTTIYGVALKDMSPEEATIALGWIISRYEGAAVALANERQERSRPRRAQQT
jgi:hypothetical protein